MLEYVAFCLTIKLSPKLHQWKVLNSYRTPAKTIPVVTDTVSISEAPSRSVRRKESRFNFANLKSRQPNSPLFLSLMTSVISTLSKTMRKVGVFVVVVVCGFFWSFYADRKQLILAHCAKRIKSKHRFFFLVKAQS